MNARDSVMNLSVPCGLGCEHAQGLPFPHLDWVWCAAPNVGGPQRLDVTFCPYFRSRSSLTTEPRGIQEKAHSM